jgi:hypothetical protein
MKSPWHIFIKPAMHKFRRARAEAIVKKFPDIAKMSILDYGGSVHFWFESGLESFVSKVSIYNISEGEVYLGHRDDGKFSVHMFDGFNIPVPDKKFDLVICNSVIEHVAPAQRQRLVDELVRVAKSGYIQTPAYEFPIEPHFVMPFLHWLPKKIGKFLVRISPWALLSRATPALQSSWFDEIQLLNKSELKGLFPGAPVKPEKFFGLTKSWMVTW